MGILALWVFLQLIALAFMILVIVIVAPLSIIGIYFLDRKEKEYRNEYKRKELEERNARR
jgi:hypothetical protein